MKETSGMRTLLWIAIISFLPIDLSQQVLAQKNKQVVLAYPPEWCPYACEEGAIKDGGYGIATDISKKALELLGYTVKIQTYAYKRAQLNLIKGDILGIPAAYKEELPEAVYPKSPLTKNEMCFWTKDNEVSYNRPADLLKLKKPVGIVYGYSFIDSKLANLQRKYPKSFKVLKGNFPTSRLEKELDKGDISVFFADKAVVNFALSSGEATSSLRMIGCDEPTYSYLAISPARKDSKQLAKKIDQKLILMKKNGTTKKIYQRYGYDQVE